MKNFRYFLSVLSLVAVGFGMAGSFAGGVAGVKIAHAAAAGSVVINEVAWAGTLDNSTDEWIELYNTTASAIDLSGWAIEDDYSSQYLIASGSIPANGYFLIEDAESSVSNITADGLISLSLANSGDTLTLKDSSSVVIDTVNGSGVMWYAGDNTTKASMERIDPLVATDTASNFGSATSGNGSVGSGGGAILGTPKGKNSIYQGPAILGPNVAFDLSNENPLSGEVLTVTAIVSSVSDLFAYGFDVIYNPAVLKYVSATESGFLNNGASTAFNAALQNGQEGTLIIGNARLGSSSGAFGSGNLFVLKFNVIGTPDSVSNLNFGSNSFIASLSGDIAANFDNTSIAVGSNVSGGVSNLAVTPGQNVYTLGLSWTAPASGADSYIIERNAPNGTFVQIGTATSASFVDSDSLASGGDIITGITYTYRIRAVKNGIQSTSSEISGLETRGLVGDNNRSGRIDGRDIENLAKHFGTTYGASEYELSVDTNFDGEIDGSDLIDIGAGFGLTYSP